MKLILALIIIVINLSNHEGGVSAKQISREEFDKAYSVCDKYNQKLDTNISFTEKKRARESIVQSLEDSEREWLATDDFLICDIGKYHKTNEYFAKLLWASEEQAVFLKPNMTPECPRILGSLYGVYSYQGMYAGAEGQDCDNYAYIFFYSTNKRGEKQLSGVYKNPDVVCDEGDDLSSPPPLFWYQSELYCRFRNVLTNELSYYKLRVVNAMKE